MSDNRPDKGNPKDEEYHGRPKPVTIFVNTIEHKVTKTEISYEEVVKLAHPDDPTGTNPGYTVLYQRGHGNKDGELVPGQSVKVKDRMSFDVTPTNLS
jgi:hypothetical protein